MQMISTAKPPGRQEEEEEPEGVSKYLPFPTTKRETVTFLQGEMMSEPCASGQGGTW